MLLDAGGGESNDHRGFEAQVLRGADDNERRTKGQDDRQISGLGWRPRGRQRQEDGSGANDSGTAEGGGGAGLELVGGAESIERDSGGRGAGEALAAGVAAALLGAALSAAASGEAAAAAAAAAEGEGGPSDTTAAVLPPSPPGFVDSSGRREASGGGGESASAADQRGPREREMKRRRDGRQGAAPSAEPPLENSVIARALQVRSRPREAGANMVVCRIVIFKSFLHSTSTVDVRPTCQNIRTVKG